MTVELLPDFATLSVENRNRMFQDATEFIDWKIQERKLNVKTPFRTMFQRGVYTLGDGMEKQIIRFHPGQAEQVGLDRWSRIQVSTPASGGDPGVDACRYNPYSIQYGFQRVAYSGFRTERATQQICIKDIRWTKEFVQQCNLIFNFLADYTLEMDENFHQWMYAKFASDAGKIYILTDGAPTTLSTTYDPFTPDADGDQVLTIPAGYNISTLNWDHMKWLSRYLEVQAPMAALGERDGRPIFGWVGDIEDWDDMVRKDENLREDFRFANPSVLINQYGTVTEYKGFGLMHLVKPGRLKVKGTSGTNLVLEFVSPQDENITTTQGTRVNVNPDWLNAEYGIAYILVKNVFMTEVPPSGPTTAGGGTMFGATPSLNGEFTWINYASDNNILMENGYYFARAERFPKPLEHDEDAIMIIYRRCVSPTATRCEIGGDDAATSPVTVDISAVADRPAAVSGSTVLVQLNTQVILDAETPKEVSIVPDGGAALTAYIADSSAAPVYKFVFTSAADATAAAAATTSWVISWS